MATSKSRAAVNSAFVFVLLFMVITASSFIRSIYDVYFSRRRSETAVYGVAGGDETVSILLPDWEVLLVVPPGYHLPLHHPATCLFPNNSTSPARLAWSLPSTNQHTYICPLPRKSRRRPFLRPLLTAATPSAAAETPPPAVEMILWSFLTYESWSTKSDVVVFSKGLNPRQGVNRPPSDLNCVFFDGGDYFQRTPVTVSAQEVFRCPHPPLIPSVNRRLQVSVEVKGEGHMVPTIAQYMPFRQPTTAPTNLDGKAYICACTMVYNVAKFLKEWVVYHSSIGIESFILYDNGSDDDLELVVRELQSHNYNVQTVLWPWPKTQEAGFSHSTLTASDTCSWMVYADVDEFVFSPSWLNHSAPSKAMLKQLLPREKQRVKGVEVGEILIHCNEFGPSGLHAHPTNGVTQGYTCRRSLEQRHKPVVLLEAVDGTLLNSIHHFELRKGYGVKNVRKEKAVVNHYKYQAWSEFKVKFRRRVSAYVFDWRRGLNPSSKDRAPGLGFEAVEPDGWADKFCEVRDDRLKNVTREWFGRKDESREVKMVWEW